MSSAAALKTEFLSDEERSSRRHELWLSARVSADGQADQVLIHNLSTTGLLFETGLALELGDEIEVELPEAGTIAAEVVWSSGSYYGCEFANPVMAAAVSASRLRSPVPQPAAPQQAEFSEISEVPVAVRVRDPNELSPLQKTVIVFGLASACWVPIIAAVAYL